VSESACCTASGQSGEDTHQEYKTILMFSERKIKDSRNVTIDHSLLPESCTSSMHLTSLQALRMLASLAKKYWQSLCNSSSPELVMSLINPPTEPNSRS
jgi:hypothetical protein